MDVFGRVSVLVAGYCTSGWEQRRTLPEWWSWRDRSVSNGCASGVEPSAYVLQQPLWGLFLLGFQTKENIFEDLDKHL